MKSAKEANPALRPFDQGRWKEIRDDVEDGFPRGPGDGKILPAWTRQMGGDKKRTPEVAEPDFLSALRILGGEGI